MIAIDPIYTDETQTQDLAYYEGIIQRSEDQIAACLLAIKEQALFKASGYASMTAYARDRWHISEWALSKKLKHARMQREYIKDNTRSTQSAMMSLAQVDEPQRQAVWDKATDIAAVHAAPRVGDVHIQAAKIQVAGGYDVRFEAFIRGHHLDRQDLQRLTLLHDWYLKGKDSDDSKWAAIERSGGLDPGDDKPSVSVVTATVSDLKDAARRWQQSKVILLTEPLRIKGSLTKCDLMIDNQVIGLSDFLGKTVEIRIVRK